MNLSDQSIELPEPSQKLATEQFPEWAVLKPEMIEEMERMLDYWTMQLADLPTLELPADRPRPAVQSFHGATRQFNVPFDLTEKLKALSKHEGVTLFMTLVAAFQVLLHRYSGQDDIVIGTPAAGRKNLELEGLLGVFANTLALRADLSNNPSFRELLAQEREIALGAYTPKDMPIAKLVEIFNPQRDLGRNPLLQVIFSVHHISDNPLQLNEITAKPLQTGTGTTQFDLDLELSETPNGLTGKVKYATDLFDIATIDRLIGHLQTLLEGIVAQPETRLSDLPLLTETERRQLLVDWNDTTAPFPADQCVHELFEAQAAAGPQAVAVIHEDNRLTYAELNAQANRLAHHLRDLGVKPDTLVAICAERNLDMVVGLLAILKAGGAYVPLDPAYPKERLAFMLEDSAPVALLSQGRLESLFEGMLNGLPMIDLEDPFPPWASQPETNLDHSGTGLTPESLAYVIYTSGSTGKPKGVMIEQRALCNLIADVKNRYHICSEDRILQFAAIAFDMSIQDIFGALLLGAALVLRNDAWITGAGKFWALCEKNAVSIITLPTLFWQQLTKEEHIAIPAAVRHITIGGEAVNSSVLAAWFKREGHRPKLFNGYGPTEATIYSTSHQPSADSQSWQSIGRPIANTSIYILDSNSQPVPIGLAGELYIGGAGIARGYLNRPELTAERFMADPFAKEADARMYKTGDLARWLADGTLEFLGRNDFQVKIRGFRIELGDIEAKLMEHPAVREAAVSAHQGADGLKRLAAYVVVDGFMPAVPELRDFLNKSLPEFMIPSVFVSLDAMPVTANGKLDRKALPEPDMSQVPNADFIAPRSPVEQLLAGIWGEVLKTDRVGIHDNFFDLGGHSLLAMQVIVRVQEQLSVEISMFSLFERSTIAALAAHIESLLSAGQQVQLPAIRQAARDRLPPLSFAQMRLWLLERISDAGGAYNIPFFLQLEGVLENEQALERAINEVIRRHDSLRTHFAEHKGVPFQIIEPSLSIALLTRDLSNTPEALREAEMTRHLQAQAAPPFDLIKGPLLRAELIRLGQEHHVLLLTFHHIISDGWSMDVFARELSALYGAFSRNQPSPLPELPIQYADYAVWQQEWLQGEPMERLLAYWKVRLSDVPTLELPTDKPRPAIQSFHGKTQPFSLSPDLTEGLKALSRREGVTLFMTLAAAFQVLLHRYSGQDDIVIGTPTAGRSRVELEDLIGFFVNTLVLRTDLSGNPSFRELLAREREVTLGAYAHQDMPFEKLVEALNPERDLSRNPLFQVMFVLQNTPNDQLRLNEMAVESLSVDNGTNQFDLTLELSETPQGLTGRVNYAGDLFEAASIDRLIGHFQTLLEGIVAHPEALLSELPLLTEAERRQLLVEWNATATPFPKDQCIHTLFEVQAATTPQAVAVIYEDSRLSYAELNAQANRLAQSLRELGVKPDRVVAICAERSLNLVVGLLAILKAGGAYVPLDPAYPKDRLAFMLEDSAPVALLTQVKLESLFEGIVKDLPVIALDDQYPPWANQPETNLDHSGTGLSPESLAYVIYTSGSTGTPKGVMVEHRNLCNLITDVKNRYHIGAEDRILQFAATAFDMSIQDIFGALLLGAGLVLRNDAWLAGTGKFWALCEKNAVSIITLPTLFWQQLAQEDAIVIPATVRHITIGGEAVSSQVLAAWFERKGYRPTLFNGYGPTEATIYSTSHEPSTDALSWQSIGRPIANTSIYVLDSHRRPVPVGVAGELYIGGAGIARGYLKRPELTAERFIADPFAAEADARMYKTGDLARWLADGTLEFVGRNDFQVKIRGFRIELGDIEAKLMEHPAVREAAVSAHQGADGLKRLAAYVVPDGFMPAVPELRDFLKQKIPEFMLPSAFVFLDALPLTANGKLDRKALPEPVAEAVSVSHTAPSNEIEHKLVDIWNDLLGLKNIGIHDNFFERGGHSLLATQMIVRIEEHLSVEIPLTSLFGMPTISALAKLIENTEARAPIHSNRIVPQRRSAYKVNH
ncbi:MAG: amino acid adenylation domain-containing protein [Methylococcaceae bacterium]